MNLSTHVSGSDGLLINLFDFPASIQSKDSHDLSSNFIVSISADLILAAFEQSFHLDSGIHVQVNDGMKLSINLFGNDVSDVVLNNAQFEFLGSSVDPSNATVDAILRIGAHIIWEPDVVEFFCNHASETCYAGVDMSIFADIAELLTMVVPVQGQVCPGEVVQQYSMALGASAGLTARYGTRTAGGDIPDAGLLFERQDIRLCVEPEGGT